MTTITTKQFETASQSVLNQDRLAAAAEHMCAAETFLHTARQAGVDEWVSVAYHHLNDAIAEHVACLRESSIESYPDVYELHASFPLVPARIVSAVFEAYVSLTRTSSEAIQATRERLSDALAA
jgi:hypothetical protein